MEEETTKAMPDVDVTVDVKTDPDSFSSPLSLSLHDCISLGEIEAGLNRRQRNHFSEKEEKDNESSLRQEEYQLRSEEVQRLPYLLRLLSSTRPLASIQPFVASKSKLKDDGVAEKVSDSIETSTNDEDEYLDRIVDRLEDVAANYSVAGGIDVVTNHLAPSVAKTLSRLEPLVKTRVDEGYAWNTGDLAAVARDPIAKRKRRRKETNLASKSKKTKQEKDDETGNGADDTLGASSDEEEGADPMDIELEETTGDRRESFIRRDSMLVASEDSQESTVVKTVSELASLIVSSLDNPSNHDVEGDDDQQHTGTSSGNRKTLSLLTLDTDDILSEKAASIATSGHASDGTMEGNDLSSTIVAIMHNAPILRSRHVASALCRASVPQAGDIISRLGANCPASVPSLLLGCIEAYSLSIHYHHQDDSDGFSSSNVTRSKPNLSCPVVTAAKSSIAAIAKLSCKESCRVQTKLQSLGIMIDMQLKLALEDGVMKCMGTRLEDRIVPICCFLIEHLSFPGEQSNEKTSVSGSSKERTKSEAGQTPGDIESDPTNHEQILNFATSCSQSPEPSLLLHFVLDEELYIQALNFFSHILKKEASIPPLSPKGIKRSQGKWSLILRAFALLLLVPVPNPKTSSDSALSASYKACIKSFSVLMESFDSSNGNNDNGSGADQQKTSKMDTIVGLMSSCAVLLISRDLWSEDSSQTSQVMTTVMNALRSTSETSDMLRKSIEDCVRRKDIWGVFKRLLYPLEMTSNIKECYAKYCYDSKHIELTNFCEMMLPSLQNLKTELDISFIIPFQLGVLRKESHSHSELLVEETKRILRNILDEEDEKKNLLLMSKVESAKFVVEASDFLIKSGSSEVPLVLPAHIDFIWSKIAAKWKISDTTPTTGLGYIFLLRLIYALIFLDKSPKSPFAFDPRSSPIKESLVMIENIPLESTRNYLLSEVQDLLKSHYPEMDQFEFEEHVGRTQFEFNGTLNRKGVLTSLCSSIRTQMRERDPELCENKNEKLFVLAKSQICDSELYSAITNAFLSSDHAPSPTYSYNVLCRDPIVCFKFPLSVWKCRSLRRIALSTLENLLTSNNAIALKESRFEETALEILAARDAIIVRCLLSLIHGGDSKNMMICSMTTNFIRWVIRNNRGLVALIVKQGIQERDLDWLIENVPETINDSWHLRKIFSERNGLTAAERLVAADAVIRVAIVHGESNEAEAGQLILTAISQLVDSFYLILGPVGLLPVDALFTAESGTPITQISQKAAFRILKALTKLKGIDTHIRRDCSIILQKLIGLCKQELQGAVAGRRKQLIKEIYDAAMKVEK